MVIIDEATQALEAVSLGLLGCRGSYFYLGLLDSHFQSQEIDSSRRSDATSSYDTFP